MAQLDPVFLPEAAMTSQKLALHFLTSKEGNVLCGYHSFKNKASFIRDGWGKPDMKVRGVPGKRQVTTSNRKTKEPDPKGLGNCGCMIQDILLEFALSKRSTRCYLPEVLLNCPSTYPFPCSTHGGRGPNKCQDYSAECDG